MNIERILSRHRQQLAALNAEFGLRLSDHESEQVLAALRGVIESREAEALNGHPCLSVVGED